MTIDNIQNQKTVEKEQPVMNVQNEVQKSVLKETLDENKNNQNQIVQMMASNTQQQQMSQTVQNQLSKGHVDIKV